MTTTIADTPPFARSLSSRPSSLAEQIVAVIHMINEQFADDSTAVSRQRLA